MPNKKMYYVLVQKNKIKRIRNVGSKRKYQNY